jgi:hypothetical protein
LAICAANLSLNGLLSNFRSNALCVCRGFVCMRFQKFLAPGIALVLMSCAANPPVTTVRNFPPCDTVGSTATTTSRGASLAYAQRSLAQIYPDARGDLLGAGYRRIRVVGRRSTCGPYKIAGVETGLVSCTVQARVCGR